MAEAEEKSIDYTGTGRSFTAYFKGFFNLSQSYAVITNDFLFGKNEEGIKALNLPAFKSDALKAELLALLQLTGYRSGTYCELESD